MKYLGLDIGTKHLGIAVSDDGGTVAFPLSVIDREGCVPHIRRIAAERGVGTVVIGDSPNPAGGENAVMADIRAVAAELSSAMTVVFEPEQYSTRQTERLGSGDDSEAAAVILQSYLDRLNRGEEYIAFD